MIKNILSKLGANEVVKTIIRCADGAHVDTYNNGLVTTFVSDVEIGGNMEVLSFYNKFEVYKNDKIIFSYEFIGDDNKVDEYYNNLCLALEKMVNELLTPCKPSNKKVERLLKMTVENGCTYFEALTAQILVNKLIFRSNLNI